MLQQLIEETGDLYDGFAFLVGELWPSSGQRNHSPTFIVGGLFFCSDGSPTCFGQECLRYTYPHGAPFPGDRSKVRPSAEWVHPAPSGHRAGAEEAVEVAEAEVGVASYRNRYYG